MTDSKKIIKVECVNELSVQDDREINRISITIGYVGKEVLTEKGRLIELNSVNTFGFSSPKFCSISDFSKYLRNLADKIEQE